MSLLGAVTFHNVDFFVSSKGITFDNENGKKLYIPAHAIRGVEQNDGKIVIGLIENRTIHLEGYDINAAFNKIVQNC